MKSSTDRFRYLGWIAFAILLATVLLTRLSARQAGVVPSADEVRYQLVGNEPIAAPDNRALVSGWSVLMFKDRKTDRCYTVFKHEDSIAAEIGTECPR